MFIPIYPLTYTTTVLIKRVFEYTITKKSPMALRKIRFKFSLCLRDNFNFLNASNLFLNFPFLSWLVKLITSFKVLVDNYDISLHQKAS